MAVRGSRMREVLKATTKTGSGSAISMLLTAAASKIMAVILGPYGVGLYSMLVQLNQTASIAGTVGGETALVQGLSSRKGSAKDDYATSVFWIFVLGAVSVSAGLLLLADWIAPMTLGSDVDGGATLVRWLALPATLTIVYVYVRGMLNGFRAIGRMAIAQVTVTGVNALLAHPVSTAAETGYFTAFIFMLSASYSAGIAIGAYKAHKMGWFKPFAGRKSTRLIGKASAKHFFSIATVTLFTGLIATGALLAVRALIIGSFGMEEAGVFNAAWTIGMTYAIIVLASFGTYYLPTLAQTSERQPRNTLMNQVLWVSTLMMVPMTVMAIVLKPLVIEVLFSNEFTPALGMLRWMLVAAYLKAFSWILAMPMLAYADMRTYFLVESFWYVGFLSLSAISIVGFTSTEGVGISFMILYAAYFAYTWQYAKRRWGFTPQRRLLAFWLLGLAMVIGSSIHTWNETMFSANETALWVAAVGAFLLVFLEKHQRQKILKRLKGSA